MLPNLPKRITELVSATDYRAKLPKHRVIVENIQGSLQRLSIVSFRIHAGDMSLDELSESIFNIADQALPYYLETDIEDIPGKKATHRICVRQIQNGRDGRSRQKQYRFTSHSSMQIAITLEKLLCQNESTLEDKREDGS